MNRTGIEWTTFSANPLKYRDRDGRVVWGCVHKSAGCRNCYSEVLAKRYGRGGPFTAQVMKGLTPFLDDAELRQMARAKRIGGLVVSGGRCFVGDMTDLFGEWVPDDLLNRLFSEVLERRQDVTWQLLTKRADRLRAYLSWRYGEGRIPARNIHVGVSVEDQATADERIPLLLQTPAAKRFVSYEPALGPVDFDGGWATGPGWLRGYHAEPVHACGGDEKTCAARCPEAEQTQNDRLDWVIVGGESGPGARPFNPAWAVDTVSQCREAGVACFYKQGGASNRCAHDAKGGHFECFPAALQVREFPS